MVKILSRDGKQVANETSACFAGDSLDRKASVPEAITANSNTHQARVPWFYAENAASKSGRLSMIILEQATQALAADNISGWLARLRPWLQDLMVQPLMWAFPMKMDHELAYGQKVSRPVTAGYNGT